MTVSSADRKAGPFDGNGSQTGFTFSFKVFTTADVLVVVTDADSVDADQVLDTDYTVSLNGDQDASPGGTVTMVTAPATGEKVTILSQVGETQLVDIPNKGGFHASIVEKAFDKVTILVQQLSEKVTRAVLQPVGSAIENLRYPAPEAGKVLMWAQDGQSLRNASASDFASVAAFAHWSYENKSGDGVTVDFTLAASPGSVANMDVSISGASQRPGIDYTLAGTTLSFTTAPASGTNNISIRYGQSVPSTDLPSPGSNRNALISNGSAWASRAIVAADIADITLAGMAAQAPGAVSITGGTIGDVTFTGVSITGGTIGAGVTLPAATESYAGALEIATDSEARAYTANKAIDGAKLATAFTGGNQSLGTSGYQKLPGGLILQWGITAVGTDATASITFPISFPSACIHISGAGDTNAINGSGAGQTCPAFTGLSKTGCTLANDMTAQSVRWLALGY